MKTILIDPSFHRHALISETGESIGRIAVAAEKTGDEDVCAVEIFSQLIVENKKLGKNNIDRNRNERKKLRKSPTTHASSLRKLVKGDSTASSTVISSRLVVKNATSVENNLISVSNNCYRNLLFVALVVVGIEALRKFCLSCFLKLKLKASECRETALFGWRRSSQEKKRLPCARQRKVTVNFSLHLLFLLLSFRTRHIIVSGTEFVNFYTSGQTFDVGSASFKNPRVDTLGNPDGEYTISQATADYLCVFRSGCLQLVDPFFTSGIGTRRLTLVGTASGKTNLYTNQRCWTTFHIPDGYRKNSAGVPGGRKHVMYPHSRGRERCFNIYDLGTDYNGGDKVNAMYKILVAGPAAFLELRNIKIDVSATGNNNVGRPQIADKDTPGQSGGRDGVILVTKGGTINLIDCVFKLITGGYWGVVKFEDSLVGGGGLIQDCVFWRIRASGNIVLIQANTNYNVHIESSSFEQTGNRNPPNRGQYSDGVLIVKSGTLTLNGTTFKDNNLSPNQCYQMGTTGKWDTAPACCGTELSGAYAKYRKQKTNAPVYISGGDNHVIVGCHFENNQRNMGGGVHIEAGIFADMTVLIVESTFTSNTAVFELLDTSWKNEQTNRNGGAVRLSGRKLAASIEKCHFEGNLAHEGGAVQIEEGAAVKIYSSTFEQNQAMLGGKGGAIHVEGSSTTLLIDGSNTFADNVGIGNAIAAESDGATVYVGSCPAGKYLNLDSSNVKNNNGYAAENSVDLNVVSPELSCVDCPAGTYSDGGDLRTSETVDCKACAGGRYSISPGQTSVITCILCASGRYSDSGEGQSEITVCKACAAGQYSRAGDGQTSPSICVDCPVGRYLEREASSDVTDCTACRAGEWGIYFIFHLFSFFFI